MGTTMGNSSQYEEELSRDLEEQQEVRGLLQLLELVDPIARCGTIYTEEDARWNEEFLAALSRTTKFWH